MWFYVKLSLACYSKTSPESLKTKLHLGRISKPKVCQFISRR